MNFRFKLPIDETDSDIKSQARETVKDLKCFKDIYNESFKECEAKLKEKLLDIIRTNKDIDIGYSQGYLMALDLFKKSVDLYDEAVDTINGRI